MGWFTAWNRRKTLFIFLIMAALMLTVITIRSIFHEVRVLFH